jgi:hypothetical protein
VLSRYANDNEIYAIYMRRPVSLMFYDSAQ